MARTSQDKRERLTVAATRVLHEKGVERTTLADIAHAAEVPVGNVYYYFKTKDQLVEAAIEAHAQGLRSLTSALDQLPSPQDRLKGLLAGWSEQCDLASRYGCPFGSMSAELAKRGGDLDHTAAATMRVLLDWIEQQFRTMGRTDARDLAVGLFASYQGISLITHTLHDPTVMTSQLARLEGWIDSLS